MKNEIYIAKEKRSSKHLKDIILKDKNELPNINNEIKLNYDDSNIGNKIFKNKNINLKNKKNNLRNKISSNLKKLNKINVNRLLLIYLIISFFYIYPSKNIKLNNDSEITLTINGTGYQQIIHQTYTPNKIIINGELLDNEEKNFYLLTYQINNITMIWNDQLTNCNMMFAGLDHIIYIDLSKFDSSNITKTDYMFSQCTSLVSLNLTNFNTSLVTSMNNMFFYCSSLISLNLDYFDISSVTSIMEMFSGCSSLKSIDLSNFDTSSVSDMFGLFSDCKSLTSINLSSFDTSSVKSMDFMFSNCNSLTSLNLSNFNTSLVKNMDQMFFGCNSLISLDLNNFDTSSVSYMYRMFGDCSVLNSLYIANFDMSLIEDMEKMFSGLSSLIILDLTNLNIPVELDINNTFIDLNTNLTYCINEKKNTDLSSQLSSFQNDCYKVCLTNPNKKFIIEKNKCLDNCYDDNIYKFEYNRLCYKKCPDGTNAPLTNSFLCKNITFETLTNKIDKIEEEIKECNIIDFINNLCKMSDNKEVNIKNIKNQLMNGTLNLLIDNLIGGEKKDLLVKEDSAIYQITSSENQNNKQYYNLSTIKLGECENILKKENNITDNETLLIFKYDYFIEGSLIPIINYEIYHPVTKQKLNLELCNDELINLNIPVSINESNLLLPK